MLHDIASILNRTAQTIRDLERKALHALHDKGDEAAYRRLMLEKTELLLELLEVIEPMLNQIDTPLRDKIRDKVQGISFRAEQALGLESVFYQAQLLYPEDYQDGDPNELERFIVDLQKTRNT